MNRVFLDLGFFQIYWYSIFIFLGVLFASIVIFKESKRLKLNLDYLTNLIFYAIIFGLIGARIYYCLFNFDYYFNHPLEILEIWNGGLAIHGGLLFGGLWVLFYSLKYKVKTLKLADVVTPGVLLGQAIGRWGNFFNQEAYGRKVTREALEKAKIPEFIIDGMKINNSYYQPMFYYESLWNITGFIILMLVRRNKKLKNGQLASIYLMWYSFGRFFIEIYRSDSLMLGNFKIAQVVSITLFIVGLALFMTISLKRKINNEYHYPFENINY